MQLVNILNTKVMLLWRVGYISLSLGSLLGPKSSIMVLVQEVYDEVESDTVGSS